MNLNIIANAALYSVKKSQTNPAVCNAVFRLTITCYNFNIYLTEFWLNCSSMTFNLTEIRKVKTENAVTVCGARRVFCICSKTPKFGSDVVFCH